MKIIYMLLIVGFLLSILTRLPWKKDVSMIFTVIIMLVFILVAGLRINIGDTHTYTVHYSNFVTDPTYITDYKDKGFGYLLILLTKISSDPQLMIFVTALITNFCYIWTFKKYSSLFELEIFMYITSGYFIVTMNGIRQALAASIIFMGTKFIVDGKFKQFLILVLIASTIHSSALILIPVYFIVRNEAWSKEIIKLIILSSIAFFLFEPIMAKVYEMLQGTRYAAYEDINEGGASIIRTMIALVPVIMAYFGKDKIKEKWPDSNVFINMSIINLIVMVFSLYNWAFARFAFYFQTYNIILLPYMIGLLFNKRQKGLIYYSLMLCYFLVFYIEYGGLVYRSNILGI